jgi:hypothetical protein
VFGHHGDRRTTGSSGRLDVDVGHRRFDHGNRTWRRDFRRLVDGRHHDRQRTDDDRQRDDDDRR